MKDLSGANCSDKEYKYTSKEEKAINEYLSGKTKTEAYKTAYNTSRMKDKTINEYASRFFSKSKIIARVDKLMEESNTKAVLTRKECLEGLTRAFYIALGIEEQVIEKTLEYEEEGELKKEIEKKILKAPDLKNLKGIADTLAKMQGWEKKDDTEDKYPVIKIVRESD